MTDINTQLNESDLKRYLYGEVSDAERLEIEDGLLLDDELYYRLLILENKLVDQYVGGKITGGELSRFEQSLEKVPERRAKIANAAALQTFIEDERPLEEVADEKKVKDSPPRKSNRFAFFSALALGFAGIILLILIPLVLVQFQRNEPLSKATNAPKNIRPTLTPDYTYSNSATPPQIPNSTIGNKPVKSSVSATLKSVEESEGEMATVIIENSTNELSLTLLLPHSAPSEGTLYAKLNGQSIIGNFVPYTQKDGRNLIKLTVLPQDLTEKNNKISITDSSGKEVAQYIFNLRKK